MNTLIKGFGMLIILITSFFIVTCVVIKTSAQSQLDQNLNRAIQQTMKVLDDQRYPITTNEQLISEFHTNFFSSMDSNQEVKFKIYGVDVENGLFDVEVSLTYSYLNGQKGQVKSHRTMVLE